MTQTTKPKEFELSFTWRDEEQNFVPRIAETISGDDLVELLSRFLMVIARVQGHMAEDIERKDQDIARLREGIDPDEIPF